MALLDGRPLVKRPRIFDAAGQVIGEVTKGWLPESPFNTNRNVPNGPSEEMFQMGLEDDKKITRRIYRLLNFRFEGYLQSGVLDGTQLCKWKFPRPLAK